MTESEKRIQNLIQSEQEVELEAELEAEWEAEREYRMEAQMEADYYFMEEESFVGCRPLPICPSLSMKGRRMIVCDERVMDEYSYLSALTMREEEAYLSWEEREWEDWHEQKDIPCYLRTRSENDHEKEDRRELEWLLEDSNTLFSEEIYLEERMLLNGMNFTAHPECQNENPLGGIELPDSLPGLVMPFSIDWWDEEGKDKYCEDVCAEEEHFANKGKHNRCREQKARAKEKINLTSSMRSCRRFWKRHTSKTRRSRVQRVMVNTAIGFITPCYWSAIVEFSFSEFQEYDSFDCLEVNGRMMSEQTSRKTELFYGLTRADRVKNRKRREGKPGKVLGKRERVKIKRKNLKKIRDKKRVKKKRKKELFAEAVQYFEISRFQPSGFQRHILRNVIKAKQKELGVV